MAPFRQPGAPVSTSITMYVGCAEPSQIDDLMSADSAHFARCAPPPHPRIPVDNSPMNQ